MKRLNAVISAVVFLFFTGCSSYPHQSWLEDRSFDKIADDRASEIVTALGQYRTIFVWYCPKDFTGKIVIFQ